MRARLAFVAMAVLGALIAGGLAPAEPAAGSLAVRLLSFNIRYGTAEDGANAWAQRREHVLATLRTADPKALPAGAPTPVVPYDFVCLQEALKFQIDYLLAGAPAYGLVGVGRDDGKEGGEYSPILYRRDQWELVESGTFWLSDTPEKPGSTGWGNQIPRVCTWGKFRNAGREGRFTSGRLLCVFNTHLDHASEPSRQRSAELIARRIPEITRGGHYVLCGDLNSGESSPVLAFLRGERDRASEGDDALAAPAPSSPRLIDTFRVSSPDAKDVGTFNGFDAKAVSGEKIDFVLAPAGTKCVGWIDRRVWDGKAASDHWAVGAVVTLGAASGSPATPAAPAVAPAPVPRE